MRLTTFLKTRSKFARVIAFIVLLAGVSTIGGAAGQEKLTTPKGVRFLANKSFDDSEAARGEILQLYKNLRVTDVLDGMDAIGLQDMGLMANNIRPLWRDADGALVVPREHALEVGRIARDINVGDEKSRARRFKVLGMEPDETVINEE